jgi:hypothetical protein
MVLESFDNRINITQLSLEQPEHKGETFNLERDMDERARQCIKNALLEWRLEDDGMFIDLAKDAVILDPGPNTKADYFSDDDWDDFKQIAKDELLNLDDLDVDSLAAHDAFGEGFSDKMAALKIIDPDRASELNADDNLHNKMLELYNFIVNESEEEDHFKKQLRLASCIKILFPQHSSEWSRHTDQGRHEYNIGTVLVRMLEKGQQWTAFAAASSQMRLLFPEDWKESNVRPEHWQDMRATLEGFRQRDKGASYAELAANMKILAADKVTISERGLEIIIPTVTLKEQTLNLPEQRNF